MANLKLTKLNIADAQFNVKLKTLLSNSADSNYKIQLQVIDIIEQIRKHGDKALLNYTNRFEQTNFQNVIETELPLSALKKAWDNLNPETAKILQAAAKRIKSYAEKQKLQSWQYSEADGSVMGQKITALDKVGIYVPGGKASYPSSVLMSAIPAKIAEVKKIIMVSPTFNDKINPLVLASAHLAGVDKIFTIGGAQAIAALAYGTQTIPMVDKIVGPGNIYVSTAKKLVFGQVGIDMLAGPSEIIIICDDKTNPDWIAMDLFAQAEHDENARAILLTDNVDYLDKVEQSINHLLAKMERKDIIAASLSAKGALIKVDNLMQAVNITNIIAPEHLQLSVANPELLAQHVHNAGAIFMGQYSAEALGDYCAGPSHVLPTAGTARYSSPLGVYDFQKRSSLINCTKLGADKLGKIASVLARGEGLTAHACSAEYRIINTSKSNN